MPTFALNLVISALVISLTSWLARKSPQLAGFIVALPISTMLVLALSHAELEDPVASVQLAKSIFAAIPLTLLFFVPFLLADRLGWSFWAQYATGTALLGVGYGLHRLIAPLL
jgi:hypothetical protein